MKKTLLLAFLSQLVLSACLFGADPAEAEATSKYFLSHLLVDTEKSLKVTKQDPETLQAIKNIAEVLLIRKQTLDVKDVQFKHLRTTIESGQAVSVFAQSYDGRVAADNFIVTLQSLEGGYWVVVGVNAI